jgi:hypothetical protein
MKLKANPKRIAFQDEFGITLPEIAPVNFSTASERFPSQFSFS